MRNWAWALLMGLALAGGCEKRQEPCDWRIVAAEQSSRCLVTYSGAPDAGFAEVGRWDPAHDPNLPAAAAKAFGNISECKPSDGGRTVLACASNGGVAAVDVATGRAKWFARIPDHRDGPHSVDVLPDGRVAVANSTGVDALQLIDLADAPFDPSRQRIVRAASVPGAHGVSWDARRGTLFVLGYTNLYEFAYSSATLSVKEIRRWNYAKACGDAYGHDLVPDGRGGYWFTNHSGVWRIDPETGRIASVRAERNVKSFSRDARKGDLLVMPRTRWWTDRLTVCAPDGTVRTLGPVPNARFYKARWLQAHTADAAPSAHGWDGSAWLSVPDAPVVDGVIHEDEPAAPGTSWFVRELVNEGEVASARWTTAGLGVYELYVNGTRVGDDFLKPGFTHPEKTKFSFSYDVTKLLRRGKGETNVLAAAVSAGWWRDKILTPLGTPDLLSTNGLYRLPPTWCRDKMVPGRRGFIGRKSAFRGVLDVRLTDGATRRVGTDTAHWKAGIAGPVTLASIFEGEHYDARRRPGFERAVYSAFGRPEVNAEFAGEILPTDGAEVCLREDLTLKPVRAYAWKGVDGAGDAAYGKVRVVRAFAPEGPFALGAGETLVVDFGQNAAAVPRFAFAAPAGTVLEARPAEMLNDANGLKARGNDGPEGSVYRVNLRAGYETGRLVRYTFAGKAVEDYLPRFTYFGYRYVSVTATAPVTILRLESVPVTSVRREMERGRVVTGDAAVNRLIANVWWGQLSNYLSVPTDCPQRNERLGWTADTQVFCEAAGYNADVTDFLRKWMRDLRDSQDARGGFPGVAPRAQYGGAFMRIGWADAGVIVPYQVFRQSGDRRIVDENWDAMARFVAHVAATRYAHEAIKGECDDFQWGDWLSLTRIESAPYRPEYAACVTGPGGSRMPKPEAIRYWNYLGGCYWAMDAQMMAEMAALTGRADAAAKYRAMAAEATAYLKATFLAADGTLDPLFAGMQTPALFALKLGLVEGAAKAKTLEGLKASVAACGGTLHTGFLGTSIVMDTLTENGLSTLAYDLLLNRKFPGWLYSVDQGATTVWERWNSYTRQDGFGPAGMNSFNHYAYGAVLAWLYKTAAGIASDPAAPGFRRVVLAPKPDRRLGFVAADYRSAAGTVRSSWRYEGSKWIWNFTVPDGATAAVTAPGETTATDYEPGEHEIVRDAL